MKKGLVQQHDNRIVEQNPWWRVSAAVGAEGDSRSPRFAASSHGKNPPEARHALAQAKTPARLQRLDRAYDLRELPVPQQNGRRTTSQVRIWPQSRGPIPERSGWRRGGLLPRTRR